MPWTLKQIRQHIRASNLLNKIMHEAFKFICQNKRCTEYQVLKYINSRVKHYNLTTDRPLIVAFGPSAAQPHYSPKQKCRRLRKNTIIKIDIWGRVKEKGAPFADITWMGVYGKPSKLQLKIFRTMLQARNRALSLLRRKVRDGAVPTGLELDAAARDHISNKGYGKRFIHRTGHILGFTSPHGVGRGLNNKNTSKLKKNVGYTIEPGIYLKGKFGIRSEIDFIIQGKKVIVTGPIQKKLVRIKASSRSS